MSSPGTIGAPEQAAVAETRSPFASLSEAWAGDLLDAAGVRPGDRVLDIACGSRVVAHAAAARVLPEGSVAALDPLEPALTVPDGPTEGDVVSRRGVTSSLPFRDAAFDIVLCQQGLQLLPDRARALGEMRRVLVPPGRIGVSVWGRIEQSPAFASLAQALEEQGGVEAAGAVRCLFSLSTREDLQASLLAAGFGSVHVRTARRTTWFASTAAFVRHFPPASPVGWAVARLTPKRRRLLMGQLERALSPWIDTNGFGVMTEAHTGVALN